MFSRSKNSQVSFLASVSRQTSSNVCVLQEVTQSVDLVSEVRGNTRLEVCEATPRSLMYHYIEEKVFFFFFFPVVGETSPPA